jgi:hypothetical protein
MFENKSWEAIGDIYANSTHIDTPYDLDDFSRIMNAYNVFKWTPEDIEEAKKTARKLKLNNKKLKDFLDNFIVLKTFYEGGEEDEEDFEQLLREINSGTLTGE